MVALIRHPGESRDPSLRVTRRLTSLPAGPWVPAFAGMTTMDGRHG